MLQIIFFEARLDVAGLEIWVLAAFFGKCDSKAGPELLILGRTFFYKRNLILDAFLKLMAGPPERVEKNCFLKVELVFTKWKLVLKFCVLVRSYF